jgi:diguanylate cyclase (GGDEF)-like protein
MLAVFTGFFAVVCGFMAQANARTRGAYIGMSGALIGAFMIFAVVLYSAIFNEDNEWIRFFTPNILLITVPCCIAYAYSQVANRPLWTQSLMFVYATSVIIQIYAVHYDRNELRTNASILGTAILFALSVIPILRNHEIRKTGAAIVSVIGVTVCTTGLLSWVLIRVLEIGSTMSAEITADNPYSGLVLAFAGIGMIGIAIGTFMLANEILRIEIRQIANTDSLTGLPNRRSLYERGASMLSLASRNNESVSVFMCDIDHFKKINDTYGHAVGDKVIRRAAQMILGTAPAGTVCGRYGGEEFCIVARGLDFEKAVEVGQRLVEEASRIRPTAEMPRFTMSAGLRHFDTSKSTGGKIAKLIEDADQSLYESKRSGRNQLTVHPSER